jgi:hypothetical protein
MNEIELLENLSESAKKISYNNKDEFDVLEKRTEMLIRKLFGDESHYLTDLKNIRYSPMIVYSGTTDWRTPFESGLKQFRNLIQVMLEEKKLSSNYDNSQTSNFITSEKIHKPEKKELKEIRVLIASPGDVVRERELLLDKLETKFRREHYEERCGARIIVEGWEYVASQTGYAQDIINSDLVAKSNIILAVFRHKLGSPTIDIKTGKDRSPSGTAEELLFAIRNKLIANPPLGMAYFYSIAPSPSLDSLDYDKIKTDWNRLKEFKEEIKNEILYKPYKIEEEILDIACKDICENIIKYFK